jgi:dethiobiotin synthetase
MASPLVIVTGTGTGIGKTHVAVAILHAWAAGKKRIVGWKPIETGVDGSVGEDARRLHSAASLHVKHPPATYRAPLSPHLAAELENREVPLRELAESLAEIRTLADGVLVELPGGLFSPVSSSRLAADWIPTLDPTRVVLVAPNRLGVLHDVLASLRAAAGLPFSHVVLSAVEHPDSSSPTNARELGRFTRLPVLEAPRSSALDLASALAPAIAGL